VKTKTKDPQRTSRIREEATIRGVVASTRDAPGAIRTRDLELRRFLLYPAELQGLGLIITCPQRRGKPARFGILPMPGWQLELDKYVKHVDSLSIGTTTVYSVTQASKPWNFGRDMSYVVFGDTLCYDIDYTFNGEKIDRSSRRPLPFPPEQVCHWCSKAALPKPLITTLSRKRGVRICYKWPHSV
jgi:hypothetical protein